MFKFILFIFLTTVIYATPYDNIVPKEKTYKEYIYYLLNSKNVISMKNIEETLNKNNEYITYHEALLKLFYSYYYQNNLTEKEHVYINLILKSDINKLKNSLEGFLFENILLDIGEEKIFTSPESCLYIKYLNKNACLKNKILISKKNNDYISLEQLKLFLNTNIIQK